MSKSLMIRLTLGLVAGSLCGSPRGAMAWDGPTALQLNPDQLCYDGGPGTRVEIGIDLVNLPAGVRIISAEFFLAYNPASLRFVSIEAQAPFIEIGEIVDEVGGTIDYLQGLTPGENGVEGDRRLAVLVFELTVNECDVVAALSWRDHFPNTKIVDSFSNEVLPLELLDLAPIGADGKPPRLRNFRRGSAECDGMGNAADLQAFIDGVQATDNCPGNIDLDCQAGPFRPGSCKGEGRYRVTCTATDACGNVRRRGRTFTIEDTEGPTLDNAARDLTVECDGSGNTGDLDGWLNANGGALVSDTCSDAADIVWTNDFSGRLSDDCGATGSATVTFTATDPCGNSVMTTATFTIEDTAAPMLDCPTAIAVSGGEGGAEVDFNITATDACDPNPVVTTDPPSGSFFEVGTTTVMATATDDCGNASECAFDVVVSCFGTNKLEIKLNYDEIKADGTFLPGVMVNIATEDVAFRFDDGEGHAFEFFLPAGSFEQDDDKFKYDDKLPDGTRLKIEFKTDPNYCSFKFEGRDIPGVNRVTGRFIEVGMDIGIGVGLEILETERDGDKFKFDRDEEVECCDDDDD